jgi:TolB-like protein/Tfp pilus assembly protein PilF
MPRLIDLVREARSRKVFHVAAIYISSSLTLLGVIDLFSRHYGISIKLFDSVLAVLVCGLPAALALAWKHGSAGPQRVGRGEAALYLVLGIVACAAVVRIAIFSGPAKTAADDKAVAVLPFQNLSDSKEDEFFSDGVTEDIITQLARIGDLKVISRTSVMAYKSTTKGLREIGRELGVGFVLEGSVRREGDRVRIVGQLINARNDRHVWAETYNRPMTDILAVQSEVAQKIARELNARLSDSEKVRLEKKAIVNAEAYAFYVRGRDYYYKYTREDNDQAIALFRKAVDLDAGYAPAWAGLGDAYAMSWRYGAAPEALDTAVEMSRKALDLDPDLAEGYKALGLAQESKGLVKEGLESYYRAVALNPNYAPVVANIGSLNYSLGKYDEALKWLRKTIELQPGFARFYALVGLQYLYLDMGAQARSWLERSLEFQPGFIFPDMVLASLSVYEGKPEEALTRIKRILAAHPDEPNALNVAGDAESAAGRYKEAVPYYEKLVEISSVGGAPGNKLGFVLMKTGDVAKAEKTIAESLAACLENPRLDQPGSSLRYYVAEAYALQGKTPQALEALEISVAAGNNDRWLFLDPLLDSIRKGERYAAIADTLKKRLAQMKEHVMKLGLDR